MRSRARLLEQQQQKNREKNELKCIEQAMHSISQHKWILKKQQLLYWTLAQAETRKNKVKNR